MKKLALLLFCACSTAPQVSKPVVVEAPRMYSPIRVERVGQIDGLMAYNKVCDFDDVEALKAKDGLLGCPHSGMVLQVITYPQKDYRCVCHKEQGR